MTAEAARVLARAFVTNPLHVAAFGANELAKNEAFFRAGLTVMKGPKLVALDGSRIVASSVVRCVKVHERATRVMTSAAGRGGWRELALVVLGFGLVTGVLTLPRRFNWGPRPLAEALPAD